MNIIQNFETQVLEIFNQTLEKNKPLLISKKLTYTNPEIFIINNDKTNYSSEIRSYIYKKDELIDVLECFIYYNGKKEATKEEFKEWFQSSIKDLCSNESF